MRITELARQAGVSSATLRYYEEQRLLGPSGRTEAGYRLYGAEAVGRLRFIQRAKSLGLSLREIRQLVTEPADSATDVARLRHAIVHKLADTERRISELEALRADLEALQGRIGSGVDSCGRIGDCECWLPTEEEVAMMTNAQAVLACTCCGCTCPSDGACTCCGCPTPDCEPAQAGQPAHAGQQLVPIAVLSPGPSTSTSALR
ncbi:MAG: heavy metal-responsive transcriptional regulator [Chloroflexi bacterium]|nr:heavy metal-responsive transcriptional regulator [Chloroflexota bacterium]